MSDAILGCLFQEAFPRILHTCTVHTILYRCQRRKLGRKPAKVAAIVPRSEHEPTFAKACVDMLRVPQEAPEEAPQKEALQNEPAAKRLNRRKLQFFLPVVLVSQTSLRKSRFDAFGPNYAGTWNPRLLIIFSSQR